MGEVFAEVFKTVPALQELFPSAEHQIIHEDIKYSTGQAKPRAMFIQLGNAEIGQGNLRVWPGTHPQPGLRPIDDDRSNRSANLEFVRYNSGNNRWFQGVEIAPLKSRSVIVYDGSVFHQGTRNTKNEPRVILYLSVVIGAKARHYADAWTISLIPAYQKKRLSIRDLVNYQTPRERSWITVKQPFEENIESELFDSQQVKQCTSRF